MSSYFLLAVTLLGIFLNPAAALTVFPCPFAATVITDLGATFDVYANTTNCNIDVSPAIGDFLAGALYDVSGVSNNIGVFEIAMDVCTGERRLRNLRRHSDSDDARNLQFGHAFGGGGTCRLCGPDNDDDDGRLRFLQEGGGFDTATVAELEILLSNSLTELAVTTFADDQGSCLYDMEIIVAVHLQEASGCSN